MSQYCCLELTLRFLSQPKIPRNYLSRASCMLSWGCKLSCTKRKTGTVNASISHWAASPVPMSDLLANQMNEERRNMLQTQQIRQAVRKWGGYWETVSSPVDPSAITEVYILCTVLIRRIISHLYLTHRTRGYKQILIQNRNMSAYGIQARKWHWYLVEKKARVLTLGMTLGLN